MRAEIMYRPAYSMAVVTMAGMEELRVESGSLVSMTEGMALQTRTEGGLIQSLKRSVLGGESFFINVFQAPPEGGQINVAPKLPGDMMVIEMQQESMLVQSGSFVAASMGVEVDIKWGGARTFFAREGLFMLRIFGSGLMLLSSYGAIHGVELAPGQPYTVDTGHLVAFTDGMGFRVRTVAGIGTTILSGEGLVVDLTGPGRVYMQTRSEDAFLSWLMSYMPKDDQ
jgi:uncharacterized protein (TIGR00266 family)